MKKIFIGIDFSKEKFDATVIKAVGVEECAERKHEVFDNKVSGFRRLLRWVKSVADEQDTGLWLFCGENTGGYSKAVERIQAATVRHCATTSMAVVTICGLRML